jgi:PAS domain S-box-containing protein
MDYMEVNPLNKQEFLSGGGTMGQMMREINWSLTPVASPAEWPQSLRTAINIMLQTQVPMFIAWGPSFPTFYNDAFHGLFQSVLSGQAGTAARELFAGNWNNLEPVFNEVMQGKPVTLNNIITPAYSPGQPAPAFHFSLIPLRNDVDEVNGVMGTITEAAAELTDAVVENIKAEKSETYFRRLADTIPVMLWMTRSDGYCTYVNKKWYEYTGQSPENTLGQKWLSIVHPADKDQMQAGFEFANKTHVPFYLEYRIKGANGKYRWILDSGSPVFDENGQFEGFIGSVIDIDKRKLAEDAVRESEKRFRQLADSMPQIVWTAEADGYTDYYNKQWYRLIGEENQFGDSSFVVYIHPDDQARCLEAWHRSVHTGEPYEIEYRFKVKSAAEAYRWFLVRALPIKDDNGQIIKWYGTCTDIDDVKRIEQSLRESEERFRTVADSAPVMVWMSDAGKHFTFFNKGWLEFTGRTMIQESGDGWTAGILSDDVANTLKLYNEAVDNRRDFELEFRLKRYDGQYRWVVSHGIPRYALEGAFLGYIGSCIDIHERKTNRLELEKRVAERTNEILRKNKELEQQNIFVEAIFDASVDLIAVVDTDFRYVSVNKTYLEVYGLLKENVLGKKMTELFPGIQDSPTFYGIQKAFTGEQVHHVTYRYANINKDYETFFVPLKNAEGEIYSVVVIAHDNTKLIQTAQELKQINSKLELRNEELRQSEERYLRMTNEVEDYAIILLSKDGYIENWNKGAEKIKGYTADEIVGKHFRIFYTYADQQQGLAERLIGEATMKGKSTYEGWRVRKDGSTFWAYTVITALHNDKNEVIGFSKVTRDLTERKLADDQLKVYAEQLEQKNKELERSNSELTSFSYVASHDLQEPLRKIQAFGNLIQARDAQHMSDVSKDYFDRMVKAAVRMQNLIDSLLEFSRTATALKNFEPTDLNVLLDEVRKELAHRIEEKKAVIQAAHLPTLTVIPFQFRQLLSNLINNSLKYSRTDVLPVVEIKADYIKAKEMKEPAAIAGKNYYRFSITDNGIGFEQEYAEKVFELFQRLHGRNEYSGSGIGLAICKKIVENHNGIIRAESEPNKGSTFYFYIPEK